MATPTTSTPSPSTATVRRTCRQTTCASTSGTWPSPTGASVSFPGGPAADSAGWAPQVRHQMACCKRAGSGAAALFHPLQPGASWLTVWHHDEFIYENFKTAVAEGYL